MALKSKNPIGIFDSGIGGLTVASAIHKMMPHEDIIYYGDTAHFPYGDKSSELIQEFSLQIADYMLSRGCKMIVIACNTASAHAFKAVKKHVGSSVHVVNVIDPAAEMIAKRFSSGKIGVIGTRGTIESGIYPRKIKKNNPELLVTSQATPLLAPMIEEGYFNNKISRTIIHSYLEKKSFSGIKAIILACTHYPLIKKEIDDYFKGKVDVVDSAEVVAAEIKHLLLEQKLLSGKNKQGKLEFYISDVSEAFLKSAGIFFSGKIKFKKKSFS